MRQLSNVCVAVACVALTACVSEDDRLAASASSQKEPVTAPIEAAKPKAAIETKVEPAKEALAADTVTAAPAAQVQAPARPEPAAGKPATTPAKTASARQLSTNAAGLAIIKESEGLRLEAYSYAGQWLIGYGHSATTKPGMKITAAQAEDLLRQDLAVCEKAIGDAVTVPINANEFSAMVSLCYNIGWQNFAASSVVRRLNAGDREGAADAFLMWTKATVAGERVTVPHLEERRQRERALFLSLGESA